MYEIILIAIFFVTLALYSAAIKKEKHRGKQRQIDEPSKGKQSKSDLDKQISKIDELIPRIEACAEQQNTLLSLDNGYLMKKDWKELLDSVKDIREFMNSVSSVLLKQHAKSDLISTFLERCNNEKIVMQRNKEYKKIELEACNEMLSNIGGRSLGDRQRIAVVTDEYNNLIIAGAGTGKTLTVVGKIKYLVERRNIKPEEILVTSFTRKSVEELKERIESAGIEGVDCKTFHKIGLDNLGKVGVANENELNNCVYSYLREGIFSHPNQMSAYIEFFSCYKHLLKDYADYGADGVRMESLKATDLTTLKGTLDTLQGQLDTIQGERVKSLEELMIANFLFLNGVEYEYERNYSGDYETEGRAYQPDFYLPEYDIWLEHFGINKQGKCPWIATLVEQQRYIDAMNWKREIHAKNGTKLLESYSYWNKDQDLLNKLRSLLKKNGVILKLDNEKLAEIYGQLGNEDKYLRSIATLVTTFLKLAKANNIPLATIGDRGRKAYKGHGYMWHRFQLFLTFTEPIAELYQRTLAEKEQIDFDDMINKAAAKITKEGTPERYRYIIIDEYQDISKSRFELIKAIRNSCDAKLMCVGDDWQAIYRFAGSDVSLFTKFGKHVGYSETIKLETTYRNSQELIDIASKFVQKNIAQVKKKMLSYKHEEAPIIIAMETSMAQGLEKALESILYRTNGSGSVLILGRHNFDLDTIYPDLKGQNEYQQENICFKRDRKTGDIEITYRGHSNIIFMSVHRAKGLEADDVVVLNLTNGMYGFPNRVEDDPILSLLLGNSENCDFAEERRLFYVALTRTKGKVYLISGNPESGTGPSPFIEELIGYGSSHMAIFAAEGEDPWNPALCPACGTGRLVIRRNSQTGEAFLGCTNYPFCNKTYSHIDILEDKIKCPQCGGWMVRRKRKRDGRPFYGCSNYPECKTVFDIDEDLEAICQKPSHIANEATEGNTIRGSLNNKQINRRQDSSRVLYAVGDKVDHKTFGRGIITKVDHDTVHVRFNRSGQTKKLLADYAPMCKVK